MKIACLRVDVDGFEGFRKGIKNLVNLIIDNEIKGTFFLNLGVESNLIHILRLFIKRKRGKAYKTFKVVRRRYSYLQNIRRMTFPLRLGRRFEKLLRSLNNLEVIEFEPHAWDHFSFTHFFPEIDLHQEIKNAIREYEKIFLKKPMGYAPPSFNENKLLYNVLKLSGIRYISSKFESKPKWMRGLLQIPLSIRYSIEEAIAGKFEIKKVFFEPIGKINYYSFYVHADAEGMSDDMLRILEEIIHELKIQKYNFMTMEEIFYLYSRVRRPIQQSS